MRPGNRTVAHREVWVAGKGEWWFEVGDHDRIDLIPEKKRYEPGEKGDLPDPNAFPERNGPGFRGEGRGDGDLDQKNLGKESGRLRSPSKALMPPMSLSPSSW